MCVGNGPLTASLVDQFGRTWDMWRGAAGCSVRATWRQNRLADERTPWTSS